MNFTNFTNSADSTLSPLRPPAWPTSPDSTGEVATRGGDEVESFVPKTQTTEHEKPLSADSTSTRRHQITGGDTDSPSFVTTTEHNRIVVGSTGLMVATATEMPILVTTDQKSTAGANISLAVSRRPWLVVNSKVQESQTADNTRANLALFGLICSGFLLLFIVGCILFLLSRSVSVYLSNQT
ncbi:unnamed protein product [Protopolystoma xenopodis]|uniref:Uncharacterized protein n=1 Tax=Protopolystoma xenopodis TaxID=117903 RepID=A0A448XQK0_9PLAT|nr:unnamed protein product [Protopolystoma xenopodis]